MGLAAVYGTARVHQGGVKVRSQKGRGSSFELYLPVSEDEASAPEHDTPTAITVARRARVLLVDDERLVRETLAKLLKELGHAVTCCRDGAEAVKLYRDSWQQVDVVILDMVMPNLTGKETFFAMREINPKVKAILASGYSIDSEAQDVLDAGALAFVQKPFWVKDIALRISEAIQV